ncbi:MAG: hypothetical protein ACRDTT_22520, partial [Pseudonocardiaceae bacterium]
MLRIDWPGGLPIALPSPFLFVFMLAIVIRAPGLVLSNRECQDPVSQVSISLSTSRALPST